MRKQFQLVLISFSSTFFLGNIALGQLLWSPKTPTLIHPHFHEASNFKADFCGATQPPQNLVSNDFPSQVCVGHMTLQNSLSVRAIVLVLSQGKNHVYLENGLPGVELLRPDFMILGPINSDPSLPNQLITIGKIRLFVDSQGEIDTVYVNLEPYGIIEATGAINAD
jgi:hypothetical protein